MRKKVASGVEYTKIVEIKGPLLAIDGVNNVAFDEMVEIDTGDGSKRLGKVLEVGGGKACLLYTSDAADE